MKPVLFLVHRIPYPPNKGDKIRSYHLLKYLSEKTDVYLGTFIDDPHDWQYVEKVKDFCKQACILPRKRHHQALMGYAASFVKQAPLSNAVYYSKKLQQWVNQTIAKENIQNVIIFSSNMGQYIQPPKNKLNAIIDFVDVDSLKWEQYSAQYRGLKKWIFKREGKTLSTFEKKLAKKSKINIFVSDSEAQCFQLRSGIKQNVISVNNGVDTQFFNPNAQLSDPFNHEHYNIVFTGMMDYWPNVDAAIWFCKEIFSKIVQKYPNLKFYIVGGNPTAEVKTLAQQNVIVTGRVPDIRPYLKYADVSVAPLRIARGIQNKVLEALSMNTPIIVSPEALEGIKLDSNEVFTVAKTNEQWLSALQGFVTGKIKPTMNAHQLIEESFAWDSQLKAITPYLE